MEIQKLYEATLSTNENTINKLHYKINKALVNLFYPKFGRCGYGLDNDHNVIISLTSYPARIDTIYLTIRTLLNQTYKPKGVYLWLSDDQFPEREKSLPDSLLELQKYGLSIKFCDNLYPHKKYYYTILENPDSAVVTVDDDVFYPENMLQRLVETAEKYPDTVCCYWAHRVHPGNDAESLSYAKWSLEKEGYEPSYGIIPTGVGGVLYPPHCLAKEGFDKEAIRECALRTDDLWLKAMSVLNHKKAVRVAIPAKIPFAIVKTQKTGLYYENVNHNNSADSWEKIIRKYPQCAEILINENDTED